MQTATENISRSWSYVVYLSYLIQQWSKIIRGHSGIHAPSGKNRGISLFTLRQITKTSHWKIVIQIIQMYKLWLKSAWEQSHKYLSCNAYLLFSNCLCDFFVSHLNSYFRTCLYVWNRLGWENAAGHVTCFSL